ncbi:MAG: hypothetical protein AAFR97_09560, partial [Bacteroidota bacterium]
SYVRGLMALTHGAPAQRLDRARRFIDERFAEPITLPQMSKQAQTLPLLAQILFLALQLRGQAAQISVIAGRPQREI